MTRFGSFSQMKGSVSKIPCKVATTGNITLSGTQTIDGISTDIDDRVLVWRQDDPTENGPYNVQSGTWSRCLDMSIDEDVYGGIKIYVTSGNIFGNTEFVLATSGAITLGSTALTFIIDNDTIAPNRQTASYVLALSDFGRVVEMNVGSANNLTVPPNADVPFPLGSQVMVAQYGTGQTTILPGAGVTLRSDGGKLKIYSQYSMATLIKIGTDEWYVIGNLDL